MSENIIHSEYTDHHIEKMFLTIEKHTKNYKIYIPIIGGDFNVELTREHGKECISVDRNTLNEGNKRGDWMKKKRLLYSQQNVHEHFSEKTTLVLPKDIKKQLDNRLIKRKYLRHNKDVEINDMIHMGSDHRCVLTIFTIIISEKNIQYKNTKKKHDMIEHEDPDQAEKNIEVETFEKIVKKTAATKNDAAQAERYELKAQAKKEKAAASGANDENTEAKTEEVERCAKKSQRTTVRWRKT